MGSNPTYATFEEEKNALRVCNFLHGRRISCFYIAAFHADIFAHQKSLYTMT